MTRDILKWSLLCFLFVIYFWYFSIAFPLKSHPTERFDDHHNRFRLYEFILVSFFETPIHLLILFFFQLICQESMTTMLWLWIKALDKR